MMSYISKAVALLAAVLLIGGCGVPSYVQPTNISEYPHRYADFDYKYAWKTVRTDQGLMINGVMKNVRYPYIDSVDLTVFVRNRDDRVFARATTFPSPQQSRQGDVINFGLLIKGVKPVPGDVIEFLVHYKGSEGNDDALDWHNSFKADALTGAIIKPAITTYEW